MKSCYLASQKDTDGHTAEAISLELSDIIARWKLYEKVWNDY